MRKLGEDGSMAVRDTYRPTLLPTEHRALWLRRRYVTQPRPQELEQSLRQQEMETQVMGWGDTCCPPHTNVTELGGGQEYSCFLLHRRTEAKESQVY